MRIHDTELALEPLLHLFEGSRNLVVHIQLCSLKDHVASLVDYVSFSIDQVASPVHSSPSFVDQLGRTGLPYNHKITQVINVKYAHYLL